MTDDGRPAGRSPAGVGDVVPAATQRLRFRRYRTADVDDVIEMFSDDEARRWYPSRGNRAGSLAWIEWSLGSYAEHGLGLWAIEHRPDCQFVGDCGLTYQDLEGETLLEIGYHLQHKHRGNGYAHEAARACLAHAFDHLRADTVCSIVDPANDASKRVAAAVHRQRREFTTGDGRRVVLYWSDRPTS